MDEGTRKMIIQNANIQFASAHDLKKEFKQKETLLTQRPDNQDGSQGERVTLQSNEVNISRREQSLSLSQLQNQQARNERAGNTSDNESQSDDNESSLPAGLVERARALTERLQELAEESGGQSFVDFLKVPEDAEDEFSGLDAQTYQLKSIVESFTGKEIKLSHISEDDGTSSTRAGSGNPAASSDQQASIQQNTPTVTASLIYQYQESYLEEETSLFQASGSVTLNTGESLDVDLSQFSQRSFYLENSLELKVGEVELTDPLVVNLQGPLSLTENKHNFDLDNDGEAESINFAAGNSGFLALDRNQNGTIDDGSELFGALTGNGFLELSELDEDGNGFVDSGDGVFTDLLFYQKDLEGNDKTQKISDLGIGALYLGHQATPFQVKDANNELQAEVRSSGIFINENGSTGSLQQIDLVV